MYDARCATRLDSWTLEGVKTGISSAGYGSDGALGRAGEIDVGKGCCPEGWSAPLSPSSGGKTSVLVLVSISSSLHLKWQYHSQKIMCRASPVFY
jgi:hypothetical protein